MSSKRKNNPLPRDSAPESVEGPPPLAPSPDTAANDLEVDFSRLTPRQQAVLPVVALAPSIAQAAHESGLSERTLRRWLDDPNFREQLSRLHREACNVARRQLQALMPHLISVLATEAIENPDPALRIRAARYAMNYAVRFCDFDRLSDDLRDLRAALQEDKLGRQVAEDK